MSKDKPEVGDVWVEHKIIYYHIVKIQEPYLFYANCNKSGISTYCSSIERFVKECQYVGKSKANINDLFEEQDND